MRLRIATANAALALLGACATTGPAVVGYPAVPVLAVAETEPVGTADDDAADDPAIWRNAADPAASLIVATDKKAGLYVYDLTGKSLSFAEAGLPNNVDLVDLGADDGVIVLASDRSDIAKAKVRVYRLDTAAGTLAPIGSVSGGEGEAYGLCARRDGDGLRVASVLKDGRIVETQFSLSRGVVAPVAAAFPQRSVPTQAEGCTYDPRDGQLYVGEENAGIWRFPVEGPGELIAPVDNRMLVADVEGLALLPRAADAGFLLASSQGDNAYAVFRLPTMEPVGRFRIAAGRFGATEETDGIAVMPGDFGPDFPGGLFVAQDGANARAAQNFKLVPWDAIRAALGLHDH